MISLKIFLTGALSLFFTIFVHASSDEFLENRSLKNFEQKTEGLEIPPIQEVFEKISPPASEEPKVVSRPKAASPIVENPIVPDISEPVITTSAPPEKTHAVDQTKWTQTNFMGQQNALGYSSKDFSIPKELRERVEFWVSIYTKYTSSQGVMHDRLDPSIVYEVLDLHQISDNLFLTNRQKYKAREKLVKEKRAEIQSRLKRLAALTSEEGLQGEDLRYWKLFKSQHEKLVQATDKESIRFQLGQKDFFIKGIYYSGRYLREMEKIFREENLPVELTRLPFVESSFNIFARSKVGASGIWQFMRKTGKSYLKINSMVDERNDPMSASRAAAKLLRSNYKVLESWPLAITAYNYGPTGVSRLVKEFKTKDVSELILNAESNRFGFASKNFYASFLAALEVESHANIYFGDVNVAPPVQYEQIILPKSASYRNVLQTFNGDSQMADLLNPHLTRLAKHGAVAIPSGIKIRVPLKKASFLLEALSNPQMKIRRVADNLPTNSDGNVYRVIHGDTLSSISQYFGTSIKSIMLRNAIVNPRGLRPGRTLVIPAND